MRASLAAAAVWSLTVASPNDRSNGPAVTSTNCMRPYGTTDSRETRTPAADEQVVGALEIPPARESPLQRPLDEGAEHDRGAQEGKTPDDGSERDDDDAGDREDERRTADLEAPQREQSRRRSAPSVDRAEGLDAHSPRVCPHARISERPAAACQAGA